MRWISAPTGRPSNRITQPAQVGIVAGLSVGLGIAVAFGPLSGSAALAAIAAMIVLLLLLAGSIARPTAAVVGIFGYLTVVGLLRRVTPSITASFQVDPLLLVAPATALALLVGTRPSLLLARRDPIGILALVFLAVGAAEVFNPLDGGVVPGVVGFLYSVFPLLWFWIGSALARTNIVNRLGWMSVGIGSCVAIYGSYQVQVGFPPWDASWLAGHLSQYVALQAGGSIRAFGTFASSAEYATFMGVGVTFVIASLTRRRVYLLAPGALMLAALFLDASRGVLVLTLLASALVVAFRSRSPRLAIVTGVTLAAGTVVVGLFSASITSAAIQTANPFVIHQVTGLLNPFDPSQSTLLLHLKLVAQGFASVFQAPFGYGPAATNLAGSRFAGLDLSSEVDISNAFVNFGLIGGATYMALSVVALIRAMTFAWRDPRPEHLWIMAVLVVNLGQWLNGGYYLLAPLTWFLIGGMNRSWWSRTVGATRALEARPSNTQLAEDTKLSNPLSL